MPRRHPRDRCRLEQERRRAAVPGRHARLVPDAGRLLDDGLRPGGRARRGRGGIDRPAIALVGDGAFGSNPNVVATAVEMGIAPIWVVMNNAAFGTIAGLERKHYGRGYGCEFLADGAPYSPDFAAIARACGAEGVRVERRRRSSSRRSGRPAPRAGRRSSTCPCATRRSPRPARGTSSASTSRGGDGSVTKVHEGAGAGQRPRRRRGPPPSPPRPRAGVRPRRGPGRGHRPGLVPGDAPATVAGDTPPRPRPSCWGPASWRRSTMGRWRHPRSWHARSRRRGRRR